jgi:hypothetical protein
VGRGTPGGQESAGKEREHADKALHHRHTSPTGALVTARAGANGRWSSVASPGAVQACPA